MQNERKKIDGVFIKTAGEKTHSLKEFKERPKEKRTYPRKKSRAIEVMSEISKYLKSHNIYFENAGKKIYRISQWHLKSVTDARDVLRKVVSISMRIAWKQEYITRNWAQNCARNQRINPNFTD